MPATRRAVLSWAFYDWANSAFATTVVAGFFPIFFARYWSAGADGTATLARFGTIVSVAGATMALLAPVLGSLADQGHAKKRLLALFAGVGIMATALLATVPKGAWAAAAAIYVVAYVGWLASCVFYDSLIVGVSTPATVDRVSGRGFALGYLGGGLLFAVNVLMTRMPAAFGLASTEDAIRWSFVTVTVWWAIFALPLLVRVPEPGGRYAGGIGVAAAASRGFRQLADTFGEVRRYRMIGRFLIAYWVYIDGVDTVITMAVAYGTRRGFTAADLTLSLLLVQFVAFPCAYAFGRLGQRFGSKPLILAGLTVYLLVAVLASRLDTTPYDVFGWRISQFAVLAALIGTVQGGVQALSRALFTRLIPADRSGEFFGFYNMIGRFAAIIGPLLIGWIGHFTGDERLGILSVSALFLVGGLLLLRVRDEPPAQPDRSPARPDEPPSRPEEPAQ